MGIEILYIGFIAILIVLIIILFFATKKTTDQTFNLIVEVQSKQVVILEKLCERIDNSIKEQMQYIELLHNVKSDTSEILEIVKR